MKEPARATFAFASEIVLAITGAPRLIEAFRREYGRVETADRDPHVEVAFCDEPPRSATVLSGSHKTVRWRVALGPPDSSPLRARISLSGVPFAFARSLVQGYYVEPLVAVAAARTGTVLLPAAAFERNGAAVLVMGRSRSGKSTLAARLGAAGHTVLGDDQVLVSREACAPFPRRRRVYPDLRQTAPDAYRSLARADRLALLARAVIRRVTRDWVAPSLAIEPLGLSPPARLRIGGVTLIERDPAATSFEAADLSAPAAVEAALSLLDEQRGHLAGAASWRSALQATAERERETLAIAFADVPRERVRLPGGWSAPEGVGALARHFGLGASASRR